MSDFWSWYIIGITLFTIAGCYWLVRFANRIPAGKAQSDTDTTGHDWDGLKELNSPLPRWWLWMFYITIIFSLGYLVLYPGLGKFEGTLGWSQVGQWQDEIDSADAQYGPLFAKFAQTDIAVLAEDDDAKRIGRRLFLNYCAGCHGSDARGAPGFPNLTDDDWLYGSAPAMIKISILDGRQGVMPALGNALGDQGIKEVVSYVQTLSGGKADAALAEAGKGKFLMFCAGCHTAEGTGNQAIGAPNLTDNIWLYSRSAGAIEKAIREGRNGKMPAHRDFLGEDKSHLMAAYVYSLAQDAKK